MIFSKETRDRVLSTATLFLTVIIQGCVYDEIITQLPEPFPQIECASNVVNGYTDKVSYTPGEQMQVFINSKSTLGFCRLDIYSVSGKLSFSVKAFLLVQTPNVINASAEGFNYSVTAEFPVPRVHDRT
jgi:hypothetical protein